MPGLEAPGTNGGRTPLGEPARRRILYVQKPVGGGSATSLYEMVRNLDRTRFEPLVLFHQPSAWCDRFLRLGIRVFVLDDATATASTHDAREPTHPEGRRSRRLHHARRLVRRDWPLARRMARLIRGESIDIVHHNNSVPANRASILAAGMAGVPQVCHTRFFAGYSRVIDRFLATPIAAFVFVSHAVGNHVRHGLGRLADRGTVIYESFDLDGFAAAAADTGATRTALGLAAEDRVVVNVGRLVPWKGHQDFLHAMAEVIRTTPRTVALIVGAAPPDPAGRAYTAGLARLADQLGISAHVRFTGHRDDVAALMAAADLVVHSASSPEPFGRVVVEAMAAGRPVVATGAGGVVEIVNPGETGWLVPPGDRRAMALAIREVLDDPAAAATIGRRAQRSVRERFAPERYATEIHHVYERLTSAPRRSPGSALALSWR